MVGSSTFSHARPWEMPHTGGDIYLVISLPEAGLKSRQVNEKIGKLWLFGIKSSPTDPPPHCGDSAEVKS